MRVSVARETSLCTGARLFPGIITGVLHVYAGFVEGRIPVALAGFGYAGALVLFFLNYRRRLLYAGLIPYTAVQFPLWIVVKSEYGIVDYADKVTQFVLILVLIYLYLNTSSESVESRTTETSEQQEM